MSLRNHQLLEPFGWPFIVKTIVLFGAILSAVELGSGFSADLEAWKNLVHDTRGALLVLFLLHVAAHLMVEVLLRRYRLSIESRRSSPTEPRRQAKGEDARKQRSRPKS